MTSDDHVETPVVTQGTDGEELGSGAHPIPDGGDTRPESPQNRPLPTDSMITVRLSDTSNLEREDTPTPRSSTALPVRKSLRFSYPPTIADTVDPVDDDDSVMDEEQDDTSPVPERRMSATSATSMKDRVSLSSLPSTTRTRSDSSGTLSSNGSAQVDWEELDKSEEQAPRDQGSDEATAFLLARLEQENDALATDPKAKLSRARSTRKGTRARPPSIQQLKKLVNEPHRQSIRYSQIPDPPPMTELEFWAALVNDYGQTVQRLPTLTSHKIRGGIPPPLRGVVWVSIAGARDRVLEEEYERLCGESSPYENLIGKDIGRSFPGVEMFRDPSGEGQQMLARVLKCFSLYDEKIGYCQGLGFVVGPLLMHMADRDAFCVLVRLMEHYDLRSCFLPDLSGLHLRIYQFQKLLSKVHPQLSSHLEAIGVEPLYVSQWFLSFFAITCPLPMLLRVYDVILTEGASETLMRVALSLMRRNEKKLLACTELEDAMALLLGRPLWDTYGTDADDLVNDFVGLTGLVTRESLESLEKSFRNGTGEDILTEPSAVPNIQAAASRFLGRLWAGTTSTSSGKVTSPTSSLSVTAPARPASFLQRTPSKQSMTSTLNSIESIESQLTASTEATAMSRNGSSDCQSTRIAASSPNISNQDRDLHGQIEDLLTALSNMQREQSALADELQKEREEREEERAAVQRYLERTPKPRPNLDTIQESDMTDGSPSASDVENVKGPSRENEEDQPLDELRRRFQACESKKRSSLMQQTKHEMREHLKLWKDQYEVEAARSADLASQLESEQQQVASHAQRWKDQEIKLQEAGQEKEQLQRTIAELKIRRYDTESDFESAPQTPVDVPAENAAPPAGLRRQTLIRTNSLKASDSASDTFARRSSSLGMAKVLSTENHRPPSEESMLLELVNAKTAEAVARQELEEVKNKLDSLRRLVGTGPSSGHRPTPSESTITGRSPPSDPPKLTPPSAPSGGGGFFSGWARRAASNPAPAVTVTVAAES